MQALGVDFVFYPTANLAASLEFYKNVLGLTVGNEKAGMYAEFEVGNVTLMIGAYGEPPKDGKQAGGAIVALAVDDVAKAIAELKSKNVPVVMDTEDYPPCYMAMIKDPDGNLVMLHHRKDGTVG